MTQRFRLIKKDKIQILLPVSVNFPFLGGFFEKKEKKKKPGCLEKKAASLDRGVGACLHLEMMKLVFRRLEVLPGVL